MSCSQKVNISINVQKTFQPVEKFCLLINNQYKNGHSERCSPPYKHEKTLKYFPPKLQRLKVHKKLSLPTKTPLRVRCVKFKKYLVSKYRGFSRNKDTASAHFKATEAGTVVWDTLYKMMMHTKQSEEKRKEPRNNSS